jgi:general secretion pathway protein I
MNDRCTQPALVRQTARGKGFTLLEVLVALAVLAIALLAALRASSTGVQTGVDIRDRLLAGWVAQNRLAEHRARREWLPLGVVRGEDSQAGMQFRWEEKTLATPNAQFRRIEIQVFPAQGGDQALASLSGFLVR